MPDHSTPALVVEPAVALIDVARSIRLEHFAPRQAVDIDASLTRADGTMWRSRARFVTDADGSLDLARAAPSSGTYEGACASGLIWSLALESGVEAPRNEESIEPRTIELHARAADGTQASASLVQHIVAAGVTREEIRADGLVGTLFRPAGKQSPSAGAAPLVVVLNGSGGGINEARAALYAAHGYAALALGYFLAPGRPDYISATPLEYFEKALAWAHREFAPADGFVALSGQSRGAELSLLLAATFSAAVAAVIGYVPSNVLHGTLRAGRPGEHPAAPAWTRGGAALPTVWQDNRTADWSAFNSTASPVRQSPSFVSALRDPEAVKRARIPLERIDAPVLLLSGTDDGFWPSSDMSETIVDELRAAGRGHAAEHLRYEGAGHSIQFPFVPTTRIVKPHAVAKVDLTAGGTPAANAYANQDSWPKVLAFLDAALARRRAGAAHR